MSDEERQALEAEVLELGESLFEVVLEARGDEHSEVEEREEIRAATDEFFSALRLLLRIR